MFYMFFMTLFLKHDSFYNEKWSFLQFFFWKNITLPTNDLFREKKSVNEDLEH